MMKLSRPEVANQELQFPRFLMPSDSFHAASTGQREVGRGAQKGGQGGWVGGDGPPEGLEGSS